MFGSNGQSSGTLRDPSRRPPATEYPEVSEWRRVKEPSVGEQITISGSKIYVISKQGVRNAGLTSATAPNVSTFVPQEESAQEQPRFPRGRITGPVKFIAKLLDAWHLDTADACALLGYEVQDRQHVEDILAGSITLRGRDAKDRITTLFRIHSLLDELFRSIDVENEWLREPREALRRQRPIDLLRDGSMEKLLTLRQFIERGAGL